MPTDEAYVKLTAFRDYPIPYPPSAEKWIEYPDGRAYESMMRWAKSIFIGGNTRIDLAVDYAFQDKETEISVVIVSDCNNNMWGSRTFECLMRSAQRGGPPQEGTQVAKWAQINVIGIDVYYPEDHDAMMRATTMTRGSYLKMESEK